MHAHDALAALPQPRQHRRIDGLVSEPPPAGDQRGVVLLHPALAQQRMQHAQRRSRARHEQATAGIAVEPVGEFEWLFRPQRTQRLDRAEGEPRAAVHGEARGLVEHEHAGVFVDDGRAHGTQQGIRRPARRGLAGGLHPDRRQAHLVVRCEPVVGSLALAVDAHFPSAQQPVYAAFRHSGEFAQQEIVEPLALARGPRAHPANGPRSRSTGRHRVPLTY